MTKREKCIFISMGLLLAYLAFIFPPSGDDFNRLALDLISLRERFIQLGGTYFMLNGRILGNGLSFFLMEAPYRSLAKIFFFLGIGYLMGKLTGIKTRSFLALILGLVFLDLRVFREIVVWNAGFFNYVPPVFLILLAIYLAKKGLGTDFKTGLSLALVSFAACLFMENIAIYVLALPLLLFLDKDIQGPRKMSIGLGGVLGNLAIFMSPVYREVSANADSYRTIYSESLFTKVGENWEVFADFLLVGNKLIILGFIFIFLCQSLAYLKEEKKAMALANALGLVSTLVLVARPGFLAWTWNMGLHILVYVLMLINGLGLKTAQGRLMAFSALSLAFAMGPLLIVSPLGARNFFTPLVFNLLLVLAYLQSQGLGDKTHNLDLVLAGLVLIKLGYFSYVYTINYRDYREIRSLIDLHAQGGERQVCVPTYTYPDYIHDNSFHKLIIYRYEKEGILLTEVELEEKLEDKSLYRLDY